MISNINNGESGASARTKINAVIDLVNAPVGVLPTARYVYLFADSSDVTTFGGSAKNVYNTAQAAYDAANTLQASLGGANKVTIIVGNITAAQAGGVTLSANYNTNIIWSGISWSVSKIGAMTGTNASGNAFRIGNSTADPTHFYNISILSLNTTATGTTGNSADINLAGSGFNIPSGINLSVTNASNTTGNGAALSIHGITNITTNTLSYPTGIFVGNIVSNLPSGTSASVGGAISIYGNLVLGNITATNCPNGNLTLQQHGGSISMRGIIVNTSGNYSLAIFAYKTGSITVTTGGAVTIGDTIVGVLTINAATSVKMTRCNSSGINGNVSAPMLLKSCHIEQLVTVGDNSKFFNCSIGSELNTASPSVNGIGTGCAFYTCSILSGSFSIDNATPVSVLFTSKGSSYEIAPGSNITLT